MIHCGIRYPSFLWPVPSELSVGDYAELLSSEPSRKVRGVRKATANYVVGWSRRLFAVLLNFEDHTVACLTY